MNMEAEFVLSKINGVDASRLSSDEALNILLSTTVNDSILLEVRRLQQTSPKQSADDSDIRAGIRLLHISDTENSTDKTEVVDSQIILAVHASVTKAQGKDFAANDAITDLTTNGTQTDNEDQNLCDDDFQCLGNRQDNNKVVEEEHTFFEQCLEPELDIEEVTLKKCNSNERLGLTVCYSNNNNESSTMPVSSTAALDSGNSATSDSQSHSHSHSHSHNNYNNNNLCGSDEDACAEVFISDIHADSIAARDGRLRQGDQILQINGKNVKNKEETETLIAEHQDIVTLLVSRYVYADEDDFNDPAMEDLDELEYIDDEDYEEEDEFYDDNNMVYENCLVSNNDRTSSQGQVIFTNDKLKLTNEKNFEIKGFVNEEPNTNAKLIDDNSRKKEEPSIIQGESKNKLLDKYDYYQEHIYETIPEDSESEPFYCSPYESCSYITATAASKAAASGEHQMQLQQKQRVAQWLGIKPTNVNLIMNNVMTGSTIDVGDPKAPETTAVCMVRNNSNLQQNKTFSGNRSAITSLTSGLSSYGRQVDLNYISNQVGIGSMTTTTLMQNDEQDNSSSAYNTGGSNNSGTALIAATNVQCSHVDMLVESSEDAVDRFGRMQRLQFTKDNRATGSPKHRNSIFNNGITYALEFQSGAAKAATVASKSTNQQQKILKQALNQQQQTQQTRQQKQQQQLGQFTAPNLSQYHFVSSQEVRTSGSVGGHVHGHAENNTTILVKSKETTNDDVAMVWKVKRRQDGTRYIVRRPARNRLIRTRGQQQQQQQHQQQSNINRDCIDVTTTEDDTISEIKLGRYWTREERKKHIERARERRMLQQKQNNESIVTDVATIADKCINRNRSSNTVKVQQTHSLSKSKTYFRLQRNAHTKVASSNIDIDKTNFHSDCNNKSLVLSAQTPGINSMAMTTTAPSITSPSLVRNVESMHDNAQLHGLIMSKTAPHSN